MRKITKSLLILCVLCVLCGSFSGCIQYIDPATGQKTWALDPNFVGGVDTVANTAEQAAPTLIALSAIWPPLALVGGAVAGVVAMWRKLKPQIAKEQKKAEIAYTATTVLFNVIEEIKSNPHLWGILKPKLEKAFGEVGPVVENVIRALRGLPPKTE